MTFTVKQILDYFTWCLMVVSENSSFPKSIECYLLKFVALKVPKKKGKASSASTSHNQLASTSPAQSSSLDSHMDALTHSINHMKTNLKFIKSVMKLN